MTDRVLERNGKATLWRVVSDFATKHGMKITDPLPA